jgi:hypothetical protein
MCLIQGSAKAINNRLPSKFVLMFDGWTEETEYFIAALALLLTETAPSHSKDLSVQVMLFLKPLLADGIQEMMAISHLQHISNTLSRYGRS